jgi:N-methylhydantoinase B
MMKKGDVFRHTMAGGGGYGIPFDRDPERVLKDVIEEKVSLNAAKIEYGVVIIKSDRGTIVDKKATIDLRRSISTGI